MSVDSDTPIAPDDASPSPSDAIEVHFDESRTFPPPPDFTAAARIDSVKEYERLWQAAKDDPETFWGDLARQHLEWDQPFTRTFAGDMPDTRWYEGGRLNVCVNAVDRHLPTRGNQAAILWEGEPGDTRVLTYRDLHREVCQFANILRSLGVSKGDRVTVYLPMIPELAICVLACARIGAVHSVIFGGFSAEAIADRNQDCQAKVVVTADGGYRRGKELALKANVDAALEKSPSVEKVLVVRRTGGEVAWNPGVDVWYHELRDGTESRPPADTHCPPESMDSEDPLFILYTSGSTGKPKGVLHTTAGYLLGAMMTTRWVFDVRPDPLTSDDGSVIAPADTYWCTADVGWITGHSYIVYGPMANGLTQVMYEGAPDWPAPDRFWQIVEKYAVSLFYTAPTAIRAFMKWGDRHPQGYDLSSLRLLGTVGEPINPAAWEWYHTVIGGGRCPIVDTWWQTETGGIMMSPLPGVHATKPGSCMRPLPGVVPAIVSEDGRELGENEGGLLVMTQPWPHMLRTLYGDHERFKDVYFSKIEGRYFAGDGARRDADGDYWVLGRVDDVINVSGHRMSTMEIESALVSHDAVVEAAVVGFPHELKGEGVCCFVTPPTDLDPTDETAAELKKHVRAQIGAHATPDEIRFTAALPKTRSGKIMRRLLRDIAAGKESTGDQSTLEDFSVLASLRSES